jgi:ABC-type amino acid transport substrate-binding protein
LLTTVNAALAAAKADGRYTRWLNQWLLLRD